MRVAVTATGPTAESNVDPRFGRCAYFILADTEKRNEIEAIANPNAQAGGGAGITSAQLVVDHDVTCVLTGNCGPKAYRVLAEADVDVIVGCTGTVKETLEKYRNGELSVAERPNVDSHFGTRGA